MHKLLVAIALVFGLSFAAPAIAAEEDSSASGQTSSSADESSDGSEEESDDKSNGNSKKDSEEDSDDPEPSDDSTDEPAPDDPTEPGDDPAGATDPEPTDDSLAPDDEKEPAANAKSTEENGKPSEENGAKPDKQTPADIEDDSVTICHANGANDYSKESTTADATAGGHHDHADDIIPPFKYAGGTYDGKNYDEDGKALLKADCVSAEALVTESALVLAAARPVASALAANVAALAAVAAPTVTDVPICHRTNSENNPYVTNSPSASGVINGHAGHTGPVFTPGLKAQGIKWGDIIPPFDFGPGLQFAGLNWTAEGQAIYNNGCQFAGSGLPGAPPAPDDDDDDGDDNDDNDDSDDSDDSDDEDEAGLPNTGGDALWILILGGSLILGGVALVNNRQFAGAAGLSTGPGSPSVPVVPSWSQLTARPVSPGRRQAVNHVEPVWSEHAGDVKANRDPVKVTLTASIAIGVVAFLIRYIVK